MIGFNIDYSLLYYVNEKDNHTSWIIPMMMHNNVNHELSSTDLVNDFLPIADARHKG